jgi:hypothetical protein
LRLRFEVFFMSLSSFVNGRRSVVGARSRNGSRKSFPAPRRAREMTSTSANRTPTFHTPQGCGRATLTC